MLGDRILDSVEHLARVCRARRHDCCPDEGATVQVEMPYLGDTDIEATQLRYEGTHDGALLLERVDVAQQDVELSSSNPHALQTTPARVHHGGMTMRLLLLADTHVPKRARQIPEQVWQAVDAADIVIHAGDWVEASVLDQLESRAARLVGVWGNNDGPDLRRRLPKVAHAAIEGIRFSVIHETGSAQGREARADVAFPDTDVLVFGHSHIPWDTTTPRGIRLLNPGSPTDRRRQPHCTMMTAIADGGVLRDVALVTVERVTS